MPDGLSTPELTVQRNAKATPDRSSFRFAKGLEAWVKFLEANKITVSGIENLEALNRLTNGRVVIAVPHERDSDATIPPASLLNNQEVKARRSFRIKIADISAHHDPRQDITVYPGLCLLGKDNFYPVDYKKANKKWQAQPFDSENFAPMADDLRKGEADVLISAYNPPHKDSPQAKRKPGFGAAYLSELTQVPVLPIRVIYSGEGKKPDANVVIGKPIPPSGIETQSLQMIFTKRKAGQQLDKADIQKMREVTEKLREKSQRIMQAVLPPLNLTTPTA